MDHSASNFLPRSKAAEHSLRELADGGSPREVRPMTIIGIAGASGAGKSLLARLLYERLSVGRRAEDIGILNEDSYYRDRSDLSLAEREKINYDHPDALEHDLLIEHLIELKQGRAVDVPQYNYALHNRSPETVSLVPPKLLILEGILILHVAALAERLDLRVFVDVPMDVCLTRRLRRDIQQRGRRATPSRGNKMTVCKNNSVNMLRSNRLLKSTRKAVKGSLGRLWTSWND